VRTELEFGAPDLGDDLVPGLTEGAREVVADKLLSSGFGV
jgi:hypothetical protein